MSKKKSGRLVFEALIGFMTLGCLGFAILGCVPRESEEDTGDDTATDDDFGGGLGSDDDEADDAADDAADDDDSHWGDDADDAADDDAGTTIFDVDFEDYAIGPLGNPWTIAGRGGVSTATIEQASKDGAGKALKINGGKTSVDYVLARYSFPLTSRSMSVNFDLKLAAADSAVGFRLYQVFIGIPLIEAEISVDSGYLQAENFVSQTYANCGAFSPGVWHAVEIDMDYNGGLYSVLLDGNATSCQGFAQAYGDKTPYGKIEMIDWSDANFGGISWFDNFRGWY